MLMLILAFLKRNNNALWAFSIIVLLISGATFVMHERGIGRKQEAAAQQKLAAALIIHKQEVESRAQVLANQIAANLAAKYAAELADPIHVRVCKYAPQPSSSLPADGGTGHAADGPPEPRVPVAQGSEGEGTDIGPLTQKHLRDADAQIEALQEYIRVCQKEGICQK